MNTYRVDVFAILCCWGWHSLRSAESPAHYWTICPEWAALSWTPYFARLRAASAAMAGVLYYVTVLSMFVTLHPPCDTKPRWPPRRVRATQWASRARVWTSKLVCATDQAGVVMASAILHWRGGTGTVCTRRPNTSIANGAWHRHCSR